MQLPLDFTGNLFFEKGVYRVKLIGAGYVHKSDMRITLKGPDEIYFIPKLKDIQPFAVDFSGRVIRLGTFMVKVKGEYQVKTYNHESLDAVMSKLPIQSLFFELFRSNQIPKEDLSIKFQKTRTIVK